MRKQRGWFWVVLLIGMVFLLGGLGITPAVSIGTAASECEQFPTVKFLLQERPELLLEYRTVTFESISIQYPERLGGHKQTIQGKDIGVTYCLFSILCDEVDYPNTCRTRVTRAVIQLASLPLLIDLNGDKDLELIPTGSTIIRNETPIDLYGIINLAEGALDLPWEFSILFRSPLREMLGGEPSHFVGRSIGRIDLDGGLLLEETAEMRCMNGVLEGVVLVFWYSKPKPDIGCNCTSIPRECAKPGQSCRINGIGGTCTQCNWGCACMNSRGVVLKYFCR